MKYYYMDLINEMVKGLAEKLKVFDKNSPYPLTQKLERTIQRRRKSKLIIISGRNGIIWWGGPGGNGRCDRGRIAPGGEESAGAEDSWKTAGTEESAGDAKQDS